MSRRTKRPNWFRIIVLALMVAGFAYFNQYVLPEQTSPFLPTATPTRSPESFVTEAQELFNQGKLLPAIESYKQAIIVDPRNANTYIALARIQVFAGEYDAALESAANAILLEPTNSMAYAVQAWALDFQGNYLEAESSIQRALEIDPNNAVAHAYYVEILVDSYIAGVGSFEGVNKAIDHSKTAIALAPDTLETRRARGYVYEATDNREEAIREFQAAIAINPNIADLHLSLGRNYSALGSNVEAIEEYTRANALNPADPTPDLLISRIYAGTGEYGKAMQYAETAVTDAPANTRLHGNLGVMYYYNYLWPEAIEQLAFVVNGGITIDGVIVEPAILVPNDTRLAEYYYTYGLALANSNQCGEALKIAQIIETRIRANENAMINAAKMNELCQQSLDVNPLPTSPQADPGFETPNPTP